MSEDLKQVVNQICQDCGNDRTRMMDIVSVVQNCFGCVSDEAIDLIAAQVKTHRAEVQGVVSFYSFLSETKKGAIIVRVCNDVVDKMKGYEEIAQAFSKELGIKIGETTEDGKITLEATPCIGMCDQAPAALINDVVVTDLTPDKVASVVAGLKASGNPAEIVKNFGDGNNANELVKSEVKNNILKKGDVIFGQREDDAGLKKAISLSPQEIVEIIKDSKLRGRGGAGFPTGLKWDFTQKAEGDKKYVLCNADEGEPGTFKDRVILTEKYDLMFEGMTIGGYTIGAEMGVLYLRGEYAYLKSFLEQMLQERRDNNLLGNNVLGKEIFNFDIRIQMGAGAYICGEETALISSCEGLRGDPKNRPPFPAQKGYLALPTTVNNVETFCCVSRILEKGAAWFIGLGSKGSPGTKLLSISGDCENPGVYEFDFGVAIQDVLAEVGAKDTKAVLIGGPSGQFISSEEFSRTICYDDLASGGSIVIFDKSRDVLKIALEYMEFFVEESCGYCTPCRVGNVLMEECLKRILAGEGLEEDLDYLQRLGDTIKLSSRCGLGQTSPNPIVTTLKNFRSEYEALVKTREDGRNPSFDIQKALGLAKELQGRDSEIYK